MNRQEYLDADKLTDGAYDGSKGQDVHNAFYSQFVTDDITKTVLRWIGEKRLLASRDVHMNDIPLKLWDDLPPFHVGPEKRALGLDNSLGSKVCVYKVAARLWLKANGGKSLWRIRYEYPRMTGDPRNVLYSYAVGDNPEEARANFRAINSGTVAHVIIDNGGTPLSEKAKP